MKRKSLFLSYDGMTDPLGSSQVIPYLAGLAERGHEITILSCEKPDRLRASRDRISKRLKDAGIDWHPLRYHKSPPVFSTLCDTWAMLRAARRLVRDKEIDTVHCRSYIPALVGLWLKRRCGTSFLFDMRGFWADERVDGNLWNLKNPVYWLVYRFFKARERDFLREADQTISLTHAGKEEMKNWPVSARLVEVIPCCVDLDRFRRDKVSDEAQRAARKKAGLFTEDKVLLYLGSIGTWYLLEEMLAFFRVMKEKEPRYKFLFLTPDSPQSILEKAPDLRNSLIILSAPHEDVPAFLSLAQLGMFFIRPAYSKKSSSPTKLGEMLAMGVPVVANAGVGDVDYIFNNFPVGHLLPSCDSPSYEKAASLAANLEILPKTEIRKAAESYFSLKKGIDQYAALYEMLPPGGNHG